MEEGLIEARRAQSHARFTLPKLPLPMVSPRTYWPIRVTPAPLMTLARSPLWRSVGWWWWWWSAAVSEKKPAEKNSKKKPAQQNDFIVLFCLLSLCSLLFFLLLVLFLLFALSSLSLFSSLFAYSLDFSLSLSFPHAHAAAGAVARYSRLAPPALGAFLRHGRDHGRL
jgi:hypothetical protein